MQIWDRRALDGDNCPAGVLVGHTEGVTHLDARGDGRYVLSNAKDQTAKLWDVRRMTSWQDTIKMHRRDLKLPNLQWDYRCVLTCRHFALSEFNGCNQDKQQCCGSFHTLDCKTLFPNDKIVWNGFPI